MMVSSPSRRRILVALSVAAILGWVALDFVPAWRSSDAQVNDGQHRSSGRLGYESRYDAGWLTAHYREQGALPDVLPLNRAAAGNGVVVELCPDRREDLLSDQADWALCRQDRAVRALAREIEQVVGVGVPEKVELFPH